MRIDGGCHCGFITYEGEADSDKAAICHCTDCQALTGTTFRFSVPVSGSTFKINGQPTIYVKTGERGNKREQAFCPRCGSPIYAATPGPEPKTYSIRVGTIRQRSELVPRRQIWARSKQHWVNDLASVPAIEKQP
jgi:hypothetical protein